MLNQFIKDIIKILLGAIILISCGFLPGYLIGRNRPPTIKTILLEDKADREYIERYNIAGEEGYLYILHKEYTMDAEFMTEGY